MSIHETPSQSDEWYTPKYIFDALECEFDTDVASPVDRTFCCVPAEDFITSDSLSMEWNGFVWMNPPFSGRNSKTLWLDKIFVHGSGIALTPDRTSAPWWQRSIDQADAILLVGKKIKFVKPDGTTGDSPGTGTTLWAYGSKAISALKRAEDNNLGKVLFR